MTNILNNIVSVFFPQICLGCEDELMHQESAICTHCRHHLPYTSFHEFPQNQVEKTFYGRVLIENATALLYYSKNGLTQHLLHQLKYKGHEEIGTVFGNILGAALKNIEAYTTIDVIVPVPLHKKRLKKRGYNQVSTFGKELAIHLNATYVDTVLIKTTNTKTQTFKKRMSRWLTTQHSFEVENGAFFEGKHILLVDDVITTGATLEACANALKAIPNIKISIATMSIAS